MREGGQEVFGFEGCAVWETGGLGVYAWGRGRVGEMRCVERGGGGWLLLLGAVGVAGREEAREAGVWRGRFLGSGRCYSWSCRVCG